jgi:Bacterial type II and III secretion system protein
MPSRLSGLATVFAACVVAVAAPFAPAASEKPELQRLTYQVLDLVIMPDGKVVFPVPGPKKTGELAKQQATREDQLIKQIVQSVQPSSWQQNGGRGTIDYLPMTGSLVVQQTPEIHQQIGELLTSLRRQQETQVALEVRVVTVSKECLQQLEAKSASSLQGKPILLTDDQVRQLIQTATGDVRTSIMQMPRVTLFPGQLGVVNIVDNEAFVAESCIGDDIGEAKAESTGTGVSLKALPRVSADRRFIQVSFKLEQTESPFPGEITGRSVAAKVTIPDGGTIVLSGPWKGQMRRVEYGPPILSDIPYLNRLFRNLGYSCEPQMELVLVTPRILFDQDTPIEPAPAAPGCCKRSQSENGDRGSIAPAASIQRATEPAPMKSSAERSSAALAELLKAYEQACAAGNTTEAKKFATAALLLDPTCFNRK